MSTYPSRRQFLKRAGAGLLAATSLSATPFISTGATSASIEEIEWGSTAEEVRDRVLVGDYELPPNWEKAVEGVDKIKAFNYGALMPWDPATNEAKKVFEEKTGVTVEYLATPRIQMKPKQTSMLAARSGSVDILQCDFSLVQDYVSANWLEDVSPLFPEGTWDHYTPAVADLYTIDGKTWMVSQYGRVEMFIWNKEMFEEAGQDPESPPRTWEEMYELIPKLDAELPSGVHGYLKAFTGEEFPQISWTNALYQADGRIVQPDGSVKYNTEEGIQAQDHWTTMTQEGYLPQRAFALAEGGLNDSFNGETVASMEIMSFAVPRVVEKFGMDKVGVTTLPKAPGGTNAAMLDSDGVGINAYSDKKAAAALYLDYIRSFQHQKNEVIMEGNSTHLPKVFEDPEVQEELPFYDVYQTSMENSYLESHRLQQTTYHYIAQYVVAGMKGEYTPQEAMDNLQSDVDALLGY
mgnify:CR=1 FL=1